jgi:hypothetical protein
MRQKKPEQVVAEAAAFINRGGYREISLSSLSSGDYGGIENLVDELNWRFGGQRVSFQLPSLRVSTFSLSLLEKISETRRSGLTFAVETPAEAWQMSINKKVSAGSTVEILREAKKRGWRGAKFYFMVGLPVADAKTADEETEIAAFVTETGRRTGMRFTVNVGIFVPKPHTPYQWAAQIDSLAATAKLDYIRSKLKPLGHKVSVSDPLVSRIEGLLSRGDERAGELAEEAYRRGSRLDAWQEFISREAWEDILERNRDMVDSFLGAKNPGDALPWQGIGSGVSPGYFLRELEQSDNAQFTSPCIKKCSNPCGVCDSSHNIIQNHTPLSINVVNLEKNKVNDTENSGAGAVFAAAGGNSGDAVFQVNHGAGGVNKSDPSIWRVLFSFSKKGSAVFHGHLSLVEMFSMAFTRACLPVMYTQGFNPLAKIEIAAPLSTGISADAEIAAADFAGSAPPPEGFAERLNFSLPSGLRVERAENYRIPGGRKKYSLSSLLWGFGYRTPAQDGPPEYVYVPAGEEKQFRQELLAKNGASLFLLRRSAVLAKNNIVQPAAGGDSGPEAWASYFDVYSFLYPPK